MALLSRPLSDVPMTTKLIGVVLQNFVTSFIPFKFFFTAMRVREG
jgi:hypothetical protein